MDVLSWPLLFVQPVHHSDQLLIYSTKAADGSAPGSEAYLRQAAESSDITFIGLSKTSPEMQIAYWRSLVESRKRGASYFHLSINGRQAQRLYSEPIAVHFSRQLQC